MKKKIKGFSDKQQDWPTRGSLDRQDQVTAAPLDGTSALQRAQSQASLSA